MPAPKKTLLLVEDDSQLRLLLFTIFTQSGYRVRAAEDGLSALAQIRAAMPDIVLSDLYMPGMSGFELLSVVRRLYPEIHVIATSGAYSGRSVPRGIAADGFHEKASGMSTLFELLELAAILGTAAFYAHRTPTPLGIDLQSHLPLESPHVFLNCPACLRPFRQTVDEIDAEIRETKCLFCDSKVDYAIALAVKPPAATASRPLASESKPIASESRSSSGEYSTDARNVRRA